MPQDDFPLIPVPLAQLMELASPRVTEAVAQYRRDCLAIGAARVMPSDYLNLRAQALLAWRVLNEAAIAMRYDDEDIDARSRPDLHERMTDAVAGLFAVLHVSHQDALAATQPKMIENARGVPA